MGLYAPRAPCWLEWLGRGPFSKRIFETSYAIRVQTRAAPQPLQSNRGPEGCSWGTTIGTQEPSVAEAPSHGVYVWRSVLPPSIQRWRRRRVPFRNFPLHELVARLLEVERGHDGQINVTAKIHHVRLSHVGDGLGPWRHRLAVGLLHVLRTPPAAPPSQASAGRLYGHSESPSRRRRAVQCRGGRNHLESAASREDRSHPRVWQGLGDQER
jgi:hypothetical protein